MKIFVVIIIIIAVLLVARFFDENRYIKKVRRHFSVTYGKVPESLEMEERDQENIAIYYNLVKEQIPEEYRTDDITWEDLDMDRIFCRMDTTVFSAGAQILYGTLHSFPQDKNRLRLREKVMQYQQSG